MEREPCSLCSIISVFRALLAEKLNYQARSKNCGSRKNSYFLHTLSHRENLCIAKTDWTIQSFSERKRFFDIVLAANSSSKANRQS